MISNTRALRQFDNISEKKVIHSFLLGILLLMSVNFSFAQEFKSKPYFTFGFHSLDTRHSTNGLDIRDDSDDDAIFARMIGGIDIGLGYEFRIRDEFGIKTGVIFFMSPLYANHYINLEEVAIVDIPVKSLALEIAPRYYFLYNSDNGFFFDVPTRLGFNTSKAKFWFLNKDDFTSAKSKSKLQFQYGFFLGYRLDSNNNSHSKSTLDISLGTISQDLGASVNKLNLEQSEYFKNEALKKSVSLVLKIAINFSLK